MTFCSKTPVQRRAVTVAPEVAARIVARRDAGDLLAHIGHDLHLTPGEVWAVLRAASPEGMRER